MAFIRRRHHDPSVFLVDPVLVPRLVEIEEPG
jgi:hypothetical protein